MSMNPDLTTLIDSADAIYMHQAKNVSNQAESGGLLSINDIQNLTMANTRAFAARRVRNEIQFAQDSTVAIEKLRNLLARETLGHGDIVIAAFYSEALAILSIAARSEAA